MADRTWFVASNGKSEGPYPDDQFRRMVAAGQVAPDTLVWTEGAAEWQRAADVRGLFAAGGPPSAPSRSPLSPAYQSGQGENLSADFPIWPLLGRTILYVIGSILVIPAPWVATSYYRWIIEHVRVPGRPNLGFSGKVGDIWWVFVLQGVIAYAGLIPFASLLGIFISVLLTWITIRWVARNITSDGQPVPLTFAGGYWPLLGWTVLEYVSIITIIGWAWVVAAMTRWICRNVDGSRRPIGFQASGWEVLWRTLAFTITASFLIPIPWMLRWYANWLVSQFTVGAKAP